ncbi:multidrug effflux MFS transporter [Kaistia dalseonensis]|uniref:Bcr/CflA family efflux transporter n=1 Tax=Kaistia dalseonensis TaxID=410840 RepID=A0ABU0HBW4_9HYPH|nr:multidrug effflux MFS transporter [Kaistia dalseonensis]MCX5497128.1 multidrug effflux MFS transporter [Kaistia dalseonensis]MDQ0439755.1 DHA1 family bicyclomycin/chloramphenicol resistance-like MFS transporter [Kaistia dalseonensis]
MSATSVGATARPVSEPSFFEFVTLIAFMMALGSMSIDNLLPAFGPIQADYALPSANEVQLILTVYMIGFAVMQLFYGPISDIVGRRPTLMIGLVIFSIGSAIALFAHSFEMLLVARLIQGMGSAATRILSVTIVRDRYEGREMARVMSITMMIFIIVPVFAPAIGSFFLLFGTWHTIFVSMLVLAVILAVWFGRRMPETLRPEYRMPFSVKRIADGARRCVTERATFGYATAMALMFGALMGYLGSTQQIFETEVYGLGAIFPVVFGSIAAVMGVASFVNSKLVRRFGMRRLSHIGVVGFAAVAALMVVVALVFNGKPPLLLFAVILAGCQFLFSLTMPNFNTMAMEPLGDIAGTASSVIGFYTTIVGALVGMLISQSFDGTVTPLALGFLVTGAVALAVVFWTEKGKLFSPHHADPLPGIALH